MKKLIGVVLLGVSLPVMAMQQADGPKFESKVDDDLAGELLKVKRVYVEDFDDDTRTKTLHETIVSILTQSKRFIITEEKERADAVIKENTVEIASEPRVVFRLVSSKGDVVWSMTTPESNGDDAQLAEKVAKQLVKDTEMVAAKSAPKPEPVVPVSTSVPTTATTAPPSKPVQPPTRDLPRPPAVPVSALSGSYSGEARNATLGRSSKMEIMVREENGVVYGCNIVQRPLFGSGALRGTLAGSQIVFEVTALNIHTKFIGELHGSELKGTYTVVSPREEVGRFELRKQSPKAPPVGFNPEECRKD